MTAIDSRHDSLPMVFRESVLKQSFTVNRSLFCFLVCVSHIMCMKALPNCYHFPGVHEFSANWLFGNHMFAQFSIWLNHWRPRACTNFLPVDTLMTVFAHT